MLQKITIALLSLAVCLPSVAAAYHTPIDIIRRGSAHNVHFDKRETLEKHNDPYKSFQYYNKQTACMLIYYKMFHLTQLLTFVFCVGSFLGQRNSHS